MSKIDKESARQEINLIIKQFKRGRISAAETYDLIYRMHNRRVLMINAEMNTLQIMQMIIDNQPR